MPSERFLTLNLFIEVLVASLCEGNDRGTSGRTLYVAAHSVDALDLFVNANRQGCAGVQSDEQAGRTIHYLLDGSDVSPVAVQDTILPAGPLADRLGCDADALRIAEAISALLQEIDAALTPILGGRGVGALYKRSLFLIGPAYPWLAELHDAEHEVIDVAALRSVVAQQGSATAAAGSAALLDSFHELLTTLVGVSLTERLLRSIWSTPPSASLAQDMSP